MNVNRSSAIRRGCRGFSKNVSLVAQALVLPPQAQVLGLQLGRCPWPGIGRRRWTGGECRPPVAQVLLADAKFRGEGTFGLAAGSQPLQRGQLEFAIIRLQCSGCVFVHAIPFPHRPPRVSTKSGEFHSLINPELWILQTLVRIEAPSTVLPPPPRKSEPLGCVISLSNFALRHRGPFHNGDCVLGFQKMIRISLTGGRK